MTLQASAPRAADPEATPAHQLWEAVFPQLTHADIKVLLRNWRRSTENQAKARACVEWLGLLAYEPDELHALHHGGTSRSPATEMGHDHPVYGESAMVTHVEDSPLVQRYTKKERAELFRLLCIKGFLRPFKCLQAKFDPPPTRMGYITLVALAAEHGHLLLVQHLCDSLNLSLADLRHMNNYLLRAVCRNGHAHVLEWLLNEYGFISRDIKGGYNACLRFSCRNGHLAVVKLLTSRFSYKGRDVRYYECQALRDAGANGHSEVVAFLLDFFPDLAVQDINGGNGHLLRSCRQRQHRHVVNVLLARFGAERLVRAAREIPTMDSLVTPVPLPQSRVQAMQRRRSSISDTGCPVRGRGAADWADAGSNDNNSNSPAASSAPDSSFAAKVHGVGKPHLPPNLPRFAPRRMMYMTCYSPEATRIVPAAVPATSAPAADGSNSDDADAADAAVGSATEGRANAQEQPACSEAATVTKQQQRKQKQPQQAEARAADNNSGADGGAGVHEEKSQQRRRKSGDDDGATIDTDSGVVSPCDEDEDRGQCANHGEPVARISSMKQPGQGAAAKGAPEPQQDGGGGGESEQQQQQQQRRRQQQQQAWGAEGARQWSNGVQVSAVSSASRDACKHKGSSSSAPSSPTPERTHHFTAQPHLAGKQKSRLMLLRARGCCSPTPRHHANSTAYVRGSQTPLF